jgi:hypothetical protein
VGAVQTTPNSPNATYPFTATFKSGGGDINYGDGRHEPIDSGATVNHTYVRTINPQPPIIVTLTVNSGGLICEAKVTINVPRLPPPPPTECKDVTGELVEPIIPGQPVTAIFTVPAGGSIAMGLASYLAPGPTFQLPQDVFRYHDEIFTGGTTSRTIDTPACYTQVDVYCGNVILRLTPTNLYGARLKDSFNGGSNSCPVPAR